MDSYNLETPFPGLDVSFLPDPVVLQEELGRHRRTYPKAPTRSGRPKRSNGPEALPPGALGPPSKQEDPGLWAVHEELLRLDPNGVRTAAAIRRTYDQLYDGRATGRWDVTQLSKTEKTHLGSLLEIWMQREFAFAPGAEIDFLIAGEDVDCKWSQNLGGWMIPTEMYARGNRLAMLMWANEDTERWALGIIRIEDRLLKPGTGNKDSKRTLNQEGMNRILWVHRNRTMLANILARHPDMAINLANMKSGQAAVVEMFRTLAASRGQNGHLVNRATVETVAQQIDSAKRVRDARKALAPEGIVIFGHYAPHPTLAHELGLEKPTLGRFLSARLAQASASEAGVVEIGGQLWRLATEGDAVVRAPQLPKQGMEDPSE